MNRCKTYATIHVNHPHATYAPSEVWASPDWTGYATCNVCMWRSRVFNGSRNNVMDQSQQAFEGHRPRCAPWWTVVYVSALGQLAAAATHIWMLVAR